MTAAKLKHDAQGFLTGEPIDLDHARQWDGLREDVRAIRAGVASLGEALKRPDFPHVALPGSAANDVDKPLPAQTTVSLDLGHARQWDSLGENAHAGAPSLGEALKRPDFERVAVPSSTAHDTDKPLPVQTAVSPNLERSRQWDGLRDDVRAIRAGVASLGEAPKRPDFTPVALAGSVSTSDAGTATPAVPIPKAVSPQMHAARQAQANQQKRGGDGRFAGKNAPASPDDGDGDGQEEDRGGSKTAGAIRSLGNKIAEVVKTSGDGAQEVDPAVKAFSEVARPLARGYQIMRGDPQKRQESWLRRIYTTLKDTRKEGGLFHKLASKRLKGIEEKKTGSGGHGWLITLLLMLGGLLARFFGKLPFIGPVLSKLGQLLTKMLPKGWVLAGKGAKGSKGGKGGKGGKGNKSRQKPGGKQAGPLGKEAAPLAKEAAPLAKEAGPLAKEAGPLAKAGGAAGKALGGAGKWLGKALRRVPLLGNLLTLGAAGLDIFNTEKDGSLTRRDKDKRDGAAVGGAAGSLAGMAAGAEGGAAIGAALGSIVPGLGNVIGGVVGSLVGGALGLFFGEKAGSILGEKFGAWVNDLRQSDIGGKIISAWDATNQFVSDTWHDIRPVALGTWDWIKDIFGDAADWVKKKWDGAVETFGDVFQKAGKLWDDAVERVRVGFDAFKTSLDDIFQSLKSLPVIGPALQEIENAAQKVGEGVSAAKDKAIELGGKAWDAAKSGTGKAWDVAKSGMGKAWDAAKQFGASLEPQGLKDHIEVRRQEQRQEQAAANPAGKPKGWALGQTSKVFESSNGGAGTVSTGKGDHGGASYGTYQLSSAEGTLQTFLDSSKYGAQFAGLQPGTPEFNAKWKAIAKSDPEFEAAQHSFIGDTHYDPAVKRLKAAGIDLSGRGAAVQDAIWSTSVQFGAGGVKSGKGAAGLFSKALAGRDVASMSDQDIVVALQDYKIANNDKLFASSSSAVRASTKRRGASEKAKLLALAETNASPTATAIATPMPPVLAQSPAAPAMQTVVASASVPPVPSIPGPPPIQPAPLLTTTLASSGSVRPIQVALPAPEIGQDLTDRRMAHIVTGGISSA